jgi:hypothetical protein
MSTVIEMLEREWDHLALDPRAARELRSACDSAGSAANLGQLERYVRQATAAEADRILLGLITCAVEGEPLAARVLLQLLLPGTRRLARRWWALGDRDERAAAAVTAVYHRIRAYPLRRRPGRVAANVLMDAALELRRAATAERCRAQLPSEPAQPDTGIHPAIELAQVLADAVEDGVIAAGDAELIAASRIAGVRLADIADARGTHVRTLQYRRRHAEQALVTAAAA